MKKYNFIRYFKEIDKEDVLLVGGKGANLGEMIEAGLPIPPGFVLTGKAYFQFLKENNLEKRLIKILTLLNRQDPQSFERVSSQIQNLIVSSDIPRQIVREVFQAYEQLAGFFQNEGVAVRSSATACDLDLASSIEQQTTFLNVYGEANLIEKVRECWASLFTSRAIFYRQTKAFKWSETGIAVLVQKMIQADSSGVMLTTDPASNNKNLFVIKAIWGLGELAVQKSIMPDHYEIEKRNFEIKKKIVSPQAEKLVKKARKNKTVNIAFKEQDKQKISDKLIIKLAKLGKNIHQHYFFPQEIEWAIEKGKIYILQTKPITTITKEAKSEKLQPKSAKGDRPLARAGQPLVEKAKSAVTLPLIIKGEPTSPGIVTAYARVVHSGKEISKVKKGEILVAEAIRPDFMPLVKKVVGIVVDKGGQISEAAMISRELGLPCVVNTEKGTKVIKNGQVITVNGKTGEVFRGGGIETKLKISSQKLKVLPSRETPGVFLSTPGVKELAALRTATKVYVNLAEPDSAGKLAKQNVDGVGLLRAEFMIAQIGVHPKKLINDRREKIFIDKLSAGIAEVCRQFSPRPVVYRTSDLKTTDYASLIGGREYEPSEPSPMLGYHGAFRYLADESVFALELLAIKKVRNKMGWKNLWLMIPYVRTVKEMFEVKRIVSSYGLIRSPSFNLWLMLQIPSNVILLEDFLKLGLDGISIDMNNLSMFLLGLDSGNEEVVREFDERNPAVLWALQRVIKICKKAKVACSICKEVANRFPDLVEKLVSWGVSSLSVSPDMVSQTREIIYEAEKRLVRK